MFILISCYFYLFSIDAYAIDNEAWKQYFDVAYYANKNQDVIEAYGTNPQKLFEHYLEYGRHEGRNASRYFNLKAYQSQYADLKNAFGDDLDAYPVHFRQYGRSEGRFAVPLEMRNDYLLYLDGMMDLVSLYGLSSLQTITGSVPSTKAEWMTLTGILSIDIDDYDGDGICDILILYLKDSGLTRGSSIEYDIYATIYTLNDNQFVKTDGVKLGKLSNYNDYHRQEEIFLISSIYVDGEKYIFTERRIIGEGYYVEYRILKYERGKINIICSFSGGGYGNDEAFYGREFLNGEILRNELLFIFDAYYYDDFEPIEIPYHTLKDAFEKFFSGFGINVLYSRLFDDAVLDASMLGKKIFTYYMEGFTIGFDYSTNIYIFNAMDYTGLRNYIVNSTPIEKLMSFNFVVSEEYYTWEVEETYMLFHDMKYSEKKRIKIYRRPV